MRIRALTGPIVLAALLASTPQLAFGQRGGEESPVEVTLNARPGTEIQAEQLGEFLAKNLSVRFDESAVFGDGFYVALHMEMVEKVPVRHKYAPRPVKYESEAVEIQPGKTYPASTWIPIPRTFTYGQGRQIRVVGFGTYDEIREAWRARECEGATHAVQITLASDDERFQGCCTGEHTFVCLAVEP